MWIAWNYQDTDLKWPLSFEQKVELFYQQALGWQLHIAELVANGGTCFGEQGSQNGRVVSPIRHSGFAVLQICFSYFETIGRYTGQGGGSADAFRKGVLEVFPSLSAANPDLVTAFVEVLYGQGRCGLYHNTRTARVGLGQPKSGPIAYDPRNRRVTVSPERLPGALKAHLERFRGELLDKKNSAVRAAFEVQFDSDDTAKTTDKLAK
jgi:hypothetical protein